MTGRDFNDRQETFFQLSSKKSSNEQERRTISLLFADLDLLKRPCQLSYRMSHIPYLFHCLIMVSLNILFYSWYCL